MRAALRGALGRLGWALLLAALLGLGRGLFLAAGQGYLGQGALTLCLRCLAAGMGRCMAWGLLLGLVYALAAFPMLLLLRARRARLLAGALFALYVLFFAALAFIHAAVAYESRIPADYREQVSFDVLLSSLLLPLLDDAVTGWSWDFIWPLLGLMLLGAGLAVLLVLAGGRLLRMITKRRAEAQPPRRLALWPGPLGLALWLLVAAAPGLLGAQPSPQAFPVVLISIDTLRADHLGCYGYQRAFTPVLDRLAAEGVVFEQAVSLSPWTLASHVTMLSGRHPLGHGVTSLRLRIPRRMRLLQELYSQAGYRTGAAVSNFLLSPDYGFDRGFEQYVYLPEKRGEWAAAAARRFFDEHAAEPFFFFLHIYDPHYPYDAPLFFNDRFWKNRPEPLALPGSFPEFVREHLELSELEMEYVLARYDAEVAYCDSVVGQALSELKRLGIYDQALIVVTADHGEEFLDHGFLGHSVTLHEEVLRVPLIVKLPGGALAGTRIEQQVRLSDLSLFLAAQSGLAFPDQRDGRDFSYLLADPQGQETGPALGFTNLFGPPRFSRRSAGWKWISRAEFSYGPFKRSAEERLFDLERDPAEHIDLAGARPGQTAEQAALAAQEIEALTAGFSAQPGSPEAGNLDPATLQRLKSLGYLQ